MKQIDITNERCYHKSMMSLINQLVLQWHKLANQRHKLQYAYLAAAFVVIAFAGIISFFRPELAQLLAGTGLVFVGAFFLNGITWALLRAFVEPYAAELTASQKPKAKK